MQFGNAVVKLLVIEYTVFIFVETRRWEYQKLTFWLKLTLYLDIHSENFLNCTWIVLKWLYFLFFSTPVLFTIKKFKTCWLIWRLDRSPTFHNSPENLFSIKFFLAFLLLCKCKIKLPFFKEKNERRTPFIISSQILHFKFKSGSKNKARKKQSRHNEKGKRGKI